MLKQYPEKTVMMLKQFYSPPAPAQNPSVFKHLGKQLGPPSRLSPRRRLAPGTYRHHTLKIAAFPWHDDGSRCLVAKSHAARSSGGGDFVAGDSAALPVARGAGVARIGNDIVVGCRKRFFRVVEVVTLGGGRRVMRGIVGHIAAAAAADKNLS